MAASGLSYPDCKIAMLGEFHCSTGMTGGTGVSLVSGFFLIVTTAPVSVATALKETFPEYVVAVNPVMDPPTMRESL